VLGVGTSIGFNDANFVLAPILECAVGGGNGDLGNRKPDSRGGRSQVEGQRAWLCRVSEDHRWNGEGECCGD